MNNIEQPTQNKLQYSEICVLSTVNADFSALIINQLAGIYLENKIAKLANVADVISFCRNTEDGLPKLVVLLTTEHDENSALVLNKALVSHNCHILIVAINELGVLCGPMIRFHKNACLSCIKTQASHFDHGVIQEKQSLSYDLATASRISHRIASLCTSKDQRQLNACYFLEELEWKMLFHAMKDPHCPVCSRWGVTPKELFYS